MVPVVAQARRVPRAAASWIGTWQTNFGGFLFYSLAYVREPGTDYSYWQLVGTWHGQTVVGGLSASYDSFSGELGAPIDPTERLKEEEQGKVFPYVRLVRTGSRITDGFWKECGLYGGCAAHHPFSGRKQSGVWAVGFRFSQHGYPDGDHTLKTQTGGAGSVVFKTEPKSEGLYGHATESTHVFHIDEIPGFSDLHITIDPSIGSWFKDNRRLELRLAGTVSASDDPNCPQGTLVLVTLTDGQGQVPDQISFHGVRRACDHPDESWTSLNKSRVNVHISYPAEER